MTASAILKAEVVKMSLAGEPLDNGGTVIDEAVVVYNKIAARRRCDRRDGIGIGARNKSQADGDHRQQYCVNLLSAKMQSFVFHFQQVY
jgi:hypothetical protein